MATEEELQAITDAAAAKPKRAAVDGRSADAQELKDLIALEKYRAEQAAVVSGSIGIRLFGTVPPGAV